MFASRRLIEGKYQTVVERSPLIKMVILETTIEDKERDKYLEPQIKIHQQIKFNNPFYRIMKILGKKDFRFTRLWLLEDVGEEKCSQK